MIKELANDHTQGFMEHPHGNDGVQKVFDGF
jgi:hypothetical protein